MAYLINVSFTATTTGVGHGKCKYLPARSKGPDHTNTMNLHSRPRYYGTCISYNISPVQCGRPLRCDYENYSSPQNKSNYHTGQNH